MRCPASVAASALATALCLVVPACALNTPGQKPEELTTARAVHRLPPEEAKRSYPVHLRAVLTYYDPYIDSRRGAIFVCDGSGCVFVSIPARPILPLHAGDQVDIDGVTGPGDYASIVEAPGVRVIGKSALPSKPHRATTDDLFSGAYDCEWVEAEGRVRSAHYEANNVALEITANERSFTAVSVRQPGANYDALVDAEVRITGNTAPVFNSRRQMVGVHLFFPTPGQIRVLRPAPNDAFAIPPMPLSELFRVSTGPDLYRVHMQGTVTLNWPAQMLCIQSGSEAICVDTLQKTAVPLGTPVDVVGFPAVRSFKPTLEDALFRPSRSVAGSALPVRVSGGRVVSDALEARLVEIDAELIGQDLASAQPTLMLRAGGVLIPAILPKEALRHAQPHWKDGSWLRVTGICSLQIDTWSISRGDGIVKPESARILLRSVDDIVVLRAPSWWTPEHTLDSFVAVCLLIVGAAAWIVILRHSVKQRTRALRNSEERLRHLSEHDAVTGLPNRILLNDRLDMALKRAHRTGGWVGLLLVDLDGFKAVNDKLGHRAGDELLCEMARRLSQCVRLSDTVARIGGDEFVVLLPDLRAPADAESIAAQIVSAVALPLLVEGGASAVVTVSIGIVTYPDGAADPEKLIHCADEAMYAVKNSGKNGFRKYPANGARQQVQSHPRVTTG